MREAARLNRGVVLGLAAILALLGATGCERAPRTMTITGETMGTVYTARIVVAGSVDASEDELRGIVEAELDRVDELMSTYRDDSELSRFNASRSTDPFPVSADTLAVFVLAQRVSDLTGGAFDVTVGPLVNAWGFGPNGRDTIPPTDAELVELRRHVGHALLEVDEAASTVRKLDPDLYCDLSAVAKGYAVDKAAAALDAKGFENYMIEVGGEVRTRGRTTAGRAWRIAIERPEEEDRAIETVVPLSGLSMATSGNYRNFREVGGQHLGHTIDPRTGRPVLSKLASVSVVHPNCATADAYATALMVMGVEHGFRYAENEGLAVVFLVHQDDAPVPEVQFSRLTTRRFGEMILSQTGEPE